MTKALCCFSSISSSSKVWLLFVTWTRIYLYFEWETRKVSNTSSCLWKFFHESVFKHHPWIYWSGIFEIVVIQFSKLNCLGVTTCDLVILFLIEFPADSGKALYLFTCLMTASPAYTSQHPIGQGLSRGSPQMHLEFIWWQLQTISNARRLNII